MNRNLLKATLVGIVGLLCAAMPVSALNDPNETAADAVSVVGDAAGGVGDPTPTPMYEECKPDPDRPGHDLCRTCTPEGDDENAGKTYSCSAWATRECKYRDPEPEEDDWWPWW